MWVSLLWDQPAEGMGDLSDSSWRQRVIRRQLRRMRGPGDSCFQREMCQTVPSPNLHNSYNRSRLPPHAQAVHTLGSPCLSESLPYPPLGSSGLSLKSIQGREDPYTVSLATQELALWLSLAFVSWTDILQDIPNRE